MGIGRITKLLIDIGRTEELMELGEPRRIPITVLYPSSEENTHMLYKEIYHPEVEMLSMIYSEGVDDKKEYLNTLTLNYKNNATAKVGKYPVVVFSHGLTADRDFFSFLFQKLCENGYVVVTVGHLYDTDFTLIPGEEREIVKMKPGIDKNVGLEERQKELLIREKDIEYVVKHLSEINEFELIKGIIDTEKIILGGHSLGAITTLYSALALKEIKGGFTFDLPVSLVDIKYLNKFNEARHLPFLNIYRYFKNTSGLNLMNNIIQMKFFNPKEYSIMLKDSDHLSFTDWYTIYPEKYTFSKEHLENMYSMINEGVLSFISDVINKSGSFEDFLMKNEENVIVVR